MIPTEVSSEVLEDLMSNLPATFLVDRDTASATHSRQVNARSNIEFGTTVFLSGDEFAGLVAVSLNSTSESLTLPANNPANNPAIIDIYLFPQYRRQGYGKAMLQLAIELCVERNLIPIKVGSVSSMMLMVLESLPDSVTKYLLFEY